MIQCLLLQLSGYKILSTMDKYIVPFFDKKFSIKREPYLSAKLFLGKLGCFQTFD